MPTQTKRVSKKFTAMYRESWMSSGHWHSLFKMKRFVLKRNETVKEALIREGIDMATEFIFVGHPKLEGE